MKTPLSPLELEGKDKNMDSHGGFKNFFYVYFWEVGGAERKGDTESEAGSKFRAVSTEPDAGLELTDHEIMTWAKGIWLSHPGAPKDSYFSVENYIALP